MSPNRKTEDGIASNSKWRCFYKPFTTLFLCWLVFACASTPCVHTETSADNDILTPEATKKISIVDLPNFQSFRNNLADIVTERAPKANGKQHFFVSKYSKEVPYTYMFWMESNYLWIIPTQELASTDWLGVRYPASGQLLNLKEDVVATNEEIAGSSYLATKEWAEEKLFDTVVLGDLIVIDPKE